MHERLPFCTIVVIATLARLFCLTEDLLTLIVLGSLRGTGMLSRRAGSAAGGYCLLLGGDRRIDGCRRWLVVSAGLVNKRRRRHSPLPPLCR
ncbi:hypothetical protein BCY90_16035 [Agrobacterium deltaense]|nr:hypothetical protein L901_17905 [Agrobacterium sp. D14]RKF41817.1 hypothetical protein BCY90_16035 [Agrobacterium deltaense]